MYYYPPCQEFLNFTEQSLVDVVVVGGNVAVVVGGCGGGFSARHVWGHPLFVCVYGCKLVDHQGFGITTKQPTINTSSEDPSQIMTIMTITTFAQISLSSGFAYLWPTKPTCWMSKRRPSFCRRLPSIIIAFHRLQGTPWREEGKTGDIDEGSW